MNITIFINTYSNIIVLTDIKTFNLVTIISNTYYINQTLKIDKLN